MTRLGSRDAPQPTVGASWKPARAKKRMRFFFWEGDHALSLFVKKMYRQNVRLILAESNPCNSAVSNRV